MEEEGASVRVVGVGMDNEEQRKRSLEEGFVSNELVPLMEQNNEQHIGSGLVGEGNAQVVAPPDLEDYGEAIGMPMADSVFEPDTPTYEDAPNKHILCLVLTIGALVSLVGFSVAGNDDWLTSFCIFYSLIIMEGFLSCCCNGSSLHFLLNMEQSGRYDNEHQMFDLMRKTKPKFMMKIECYHYETRTRYVTETYQENGETKRRTKLETYREKVITHRATGEKFYSSWSDLSGPGPRLADVAQNEDAIALLVYVKRVLDLEPDGTAENFELQKQRFLNDNRYMDQHYDFSEYISQDNFQKTVMLVDQQRKPWYLSVWVYILATLLFCSWPYRRHFHSMTIKSVWTLRIKVSVQPNAFQTIPDAATIG